MMGLSWERFPAQQVTIALSGILAASSLLPLFLHGSYLVLGRIALVAVIVYNFIYGVALWSKLLDRRNKVTLETLTTWEAASRKDGNQVSTHLSVPYYDIVTDWYEFGWGESFQLGGAQGCREESFAERLRRHNYWFAHRAGIQKGQKWMDLGCGIGGPMRNISRFTEAEIVGLNVNEYQLMKARELLKRERMEKLCSVVCSDFKDLAKHFKPDSFDGMYSMEAICHSEDPSSLFVDIVKILKPGGVYCSFEWLLTDKYDPNDATHRRCKKAVEIFGGVGCLRTIQEFKAAVQKAGLIFQTEDDFDRHQDHLYPEAWQLKFNPNASILNFPISRLGIQMAHWMLVASEFCRLVPAGSSATHKKICSRIPDVRLSGELKIFTPHYFSMWKKEGKEQ